MPTKTDNPIRAVEAVYKAWDAALGAKDLHASRRSAGATAPASSPTGGR